MFIGHYGPSFALRRMQPEIPLWVLFLAVQLVDIAWAILVMFGIEKVRIVPGITATNPFDLYYMPYTHSLVAAVVWSVMAGVVYGVLRDRSRMTRIAWAVGIAVFSHWILDLLVHRPDLPLYDDTAKVGLGLWNLPMVALALEVGSVVIGMVYYLRGGRARDRIGSLGPWIFLVLLILLQTVIFFGRPPETPDQAAVSALVSYFLLAAVAGWLDRHRTIVSRHGGA